MSASGLTFSYQLRLDNSVETSHSREMVEVWHRGKHDTLFYNRSLFSLGPQRLSADGTTLAVMVSTATGAGVEWSFDVRAFNETTGQWELRGQPYFSIQPPLRLENNAKPGIAISANGTRLVIGGIVDDSVHTLCDDATIVFRVYDYDLTTNTWGQVGDDANDQTPVASQTFHVDITMSDTADRIVYGLPGASLADCMYKNEKNDSLLRGYEGKVVTLEFDSESNKWEEIGNPLTGKTHSEMLGTSVSLSGDGNRLAVGSTGSWTSGNIQIYNFDRVSDETWSPITSKTLGESMSDRLGRKVELDPTGNYVVAAHRYGFDAKDAHVYKIVC